MNGEHVAIKVHRSIRLVVTQFAQKLEFVRVLLETSVHYLFVVDILYMAVQIGSAGQCFVTFWAVVFYVEMNAFLVHFHVALLVGFIFTVVKVTVVFANRVGDFFLALPGIQKLNVVPPQLPVVIKTLLTILAFEILYSIVNYFLMLSKVGKEFVANVAEFFLWILNGVDGLVVGIQIRLLGKRLAAELAGKQKWF